MYEDLFGSMYAVCMYVCMYAALVRRHKTGTGNVRYDVQRRLICDGMRGENRREDEKMKCRRWVSNVEFESRKDAYMMFRCVVADCWLVG
jgi:hypothetical protein